MIALIGTDDEHSSREILRTRIETVGDLQGGIEVGHPLLGYKLLTTENGARSFKSNQAGRLTEKLNDCIKRRPLLTGGTINTYRWCLASGNRLGREVI
jgi:hypothetical protein